MVFLFFKSLYLHLSCFYTGGLRPLLLIREGVKSPFRSVAIGTRNIYTSSVEWLSTLSLTSMSLISHIHTHSHLHKHIFPFSPWQLQSTLTNLLSSLLPPFHFYCNFFFLSSPLLVFASIFPGAFYYTAKVAFVSPPRLKPKAPVCQRAQLCEDKWTLTWKCDNSQRVFQKTLTSLNGNFFLALAAFTWMCKGS